MPISQEIASPSKSARCPSGVSPERLDESPAASLFSVVQRPLFVAGHPAVAEHVNAALPDIADGSRIGLHELEMGHEHPAHPAVRGYHGVALEAFVPGAHPDLELRVALPARQHEAPFVA